MSINPQSAHYPPNLYNEPLGYSSQPNFSPSYPASQQLQQPFYQSDNYTAQQAAPPMSSNSTPDYTGTVTPHPDGSMREKQPVRHNSGISKTAIALGTAATLAIAGFATHKLKPELFTKVADITPEFAKNGYNKSVEFIKSGIDKVAFWR